MEEQVKLFICPYDFGVNFSSICFLYLVNYVWFGTVIDSILNDISIPPFRYTLPPIKRCTYRTIYNKWVENMIACHKYLKNINFPLIFNLLQTINNNIQIGNENINLKQLVCFSTTFSYLYISHQNEKPFNCLLHNFWILDCHSSSHHTHYGYVIHSGAQKHEMLFKTSYHLRE